MKLIKKNTNYCPVFEERRNRVVRLSITQSETAVYKKLQEYLLRKIEQTGIYVETNPTSNVTIGDMDDLRHHPIFRMNSLSPDGHHVMVTINSDDPAVFNTNVENELAYIYYAMEHGGYAKEDILNWIDKIRQNGMDASFVQKLISVTFLHFWLVQTIIPASAGILDGAQSTLPENILQLLK